MDIQSSKSEKLIRALKKYLEDFPVKQSEVEHFPKFINAILGNYINIYSEHLQNLVDDQARGVRIFNKINSFKTTIDEVLNLYYSGNIYRSTSVFNSFIREIISRKIPKSIQEIKVNTPFYKSRIGNHQTLSKNDIFHIKFEDRHLVSTNRFSVPGVPAIYLADSVYTCWEEFDRSKIKEMWFSKFSNTKKLKVVKIQRVQDFLKSLDNVKSEQEKLEMIFDFLVLYPLSLICSIRVKNPKGNFKPEYIVPQLLLQYVTVNNNIDGIKFPSTKVDYSRLQRIPSYNYVFPVKSVSERGFCENLKGIFALSDPTTLEMEEVVSASYHIKETPFDAMESRKIKIFDGGYSPYGKTAFGKLEDILKRKQCLKLDEITSHNPEFDSLN